MFSSLAPSVSKGRVARDTYVHVALAMLGRLLSVCGGSNAPRRRAPEAWTHDLSASFHIGKVSQIKPVHPNYYCRAATASGAVLWCAVSQEGDD